MNLIHIPTIWIYLGTIQVEPTVTCRPPYRSVREEFHSYGSSANRCTSQLTLQLGKGKAETRKSPRITMLPNALSGSLVTRFVASKYLPWFPAKERYARLRLPCSGSRWQHFPTLPNAFQHSSVLRSAKTAKSPSRETSLREAVVARYLACTRLFVSLPILLRGRLAAAPKCNSATAPGLLVSRYTSTSGYLARRQMALPSSQVTPVRTCPGL